jgi:hypothetical protein
MAPDAPLHEVLARVGAADRAREAAGHLPRGRAALAGYLGDGPARAGTGRAPAPPAPTAKRLKRWCQGLRRFGAPVLVRAAVAAARRAAEAADGTGDLEVEALLGAGEAWVRCPCASHAEAARLRAIEGRDEVVRAFAAPGLVARVADTLAGRRRDQRAWALEAARQAAVAASLAAGEARDVAAALVRGVDAAGRALDPRDPTEVHVAIREALLPWVFERPAAPRPVG